MNLIRSLMTIFLLSVVAVSVAGWIWAGGQPSPKLEGARFVLALCILMGVGSMGILWTTKNSQAG